MAQLLIKNALYQNEIKDIRISGDRVKEISSSLSPLQGEELIDVHGALTVPGLVDCHAHIDKSHLNDAGRTHFVHGTGPAKGGLTRQEKAGFTVADIRERAEKVIKTAVSSGTLIMRTNCDVDAIVGLKGIEALLSLKEQYSGIIDLQIAAFAQEGIFQDGKTPQLLEQALKLGADLVGGHTIAAGEGEKHIDFILNLAAKYGTAADFHLDESGRRENYLLPYTASKLKELGLEGRVNAIHMCTLAALDEDELDKAIELIQDSKITATIAPTAISTRQIAPVKRLLSAGIPVGLGSDNIRDFFNPLGNGDIKNIALLLCYLQAFFTDEEISQVWDMLTVGGAEVLGVRDYGIRENGIAHITCFEASEPKEIIANQLRPELIIRSGKIINS